MSHEKTATQPILDRHAVLALVTAEYMATGEPVTPTQAYEMCNATQWARPGLKAVLTDLVRDGLLLMEGLGWMPCEGAKQAYQRVFEDEKKRLGSDRALKDASTL
ncbi:hypothetical protein SAMN05660443_0226 [Marinospirillum celere]|uniref:Uncharacterized protein n=1 Tax=Marinospirillum celere TaxID=1122252 RepID=A0A1I1DZV6_9GAMM|nr:hypothetical protein [Marinospirillum celere]SFB80347.1 hypothetical protein SAMN05660443_0226 [Marinospirillum celere]